MPSPSLDNPIRNDGSIGIEGLDVGEADLLASLEQEDTGALAAGAVSGDEVWFEFVTLEDDRVRPAHAALHGSVWRVGDPAAPVPPIDYGCRCGMRYVAPPGTKAAKFLPPAPRSPQTHEAVISQYLVDRFDTNQKALRALVDKLNKLPLADRQGAATVQVQALLRKLDEAGTLTDARQLANMILALKRARPDEVQPPEPAV